MRKKIPRWNWYNGLFLWAFEDQLRLNPNQQIGDFFDNFKKQNGLADVQFSLKNQGTVIALLFALMVVPREIWDRDSKTTNFPFATRNEFKLKQGSNKDTWDFLRLLRNSVSHANFDIDIEKQTYRFWNVSNGQVSFEVEITHEGIGVFLTEVGKYYINEVKAQHTL